jgi:hypothetical protein
MNQALVVGSAVYATGLTWELLAHGWHVTMLGPLAGPLCTVEYAHSVSEVLADGGMTRFNLAVRVDPALEEEWEYLVAIASEPLAFVDLSKDADASVGDDTPRALWKRGIAAAGQCLNPGVRLRDAMIMQ